VSCELPRFAALFGLFEPGATAYAKAAKTAEEVDLEFRIALAELGRQVRIVLDAGGDPAVSAPVSDALNALAASARDSVDVSPRETAKFHLMTAAGHARSLGKTELADTLAAEALELAELFAAALVDGDPCADGREMYAAIAQLDALGGSAALIASLSARLSATGESCDERWAGTITFLMPVSKGHPGLDDLVAFVPSPWRETYWVDFTVNTKTNSLKGECIANISMPIVMYLDETSECANWIRIKGEPPASRVEMEFSGSFDGSMFAIGRLSQTGGTAVTVSQRWYFETKKDDRCEQIMDVTYPFPGHTGFLSHGMYEDAPVFSLEDLLNFGARIGGDGRVSSSGGSSDFVNPTPESGKYPFVSGDATWSLTRID
jgi:hypothetical protein